VANLVKDAALVGRPRDQLLVGYYSLEGGVLAPTSDIFVALV
jgi:hypothetical protein